jgi:Flp pilus assembly protein TadG
MEEKLTVLGRNFSSARNWSSSRAACSIKREAGVIAIMTAVLLPVIFGFFMLALDLSRMYNRKAEMQTLADAVAIAAAKKLNGTTAGVNAALAAAKQVVEDPANGPKYAYLNNITWENAAIKFASSREASASWKSDGEATASPAGLVFVKVDTKQLSGQYGKVDMFFAPMLSSSFGSVEVGHVSIAGKGRLQVTPLAICAISPTARDKRSSNTAFVVGSAMTS